MPYKAKPEKTKKDCTKCKGTGRCKHIGQTITNGTCVLCKSTKGVCVPCQGTGKILDHFH